MTASEFWGYLLLVLITSPIWLCLIVGLLAVAGTVWVAVCTLVGLVEEPKKT